MKVMARTTGERRLIAGLDLGPEYTEHDVLFEQYNVLRRAKDVDVVPLRGRGERAVVASSEKAVVG